VALPGNLTTVTLTGTYLDLQGNPIRGQVRFTPRTATLDSAADVILIPSAITVSLDETGSFLVVLPATDDADLIPTGFTYKVEETFTGGRTFDIQLPSSGVSVNLADLTPAVASDGSGAIYVAQSQYVSVDSRLTTVETSASAYNSVGTAAVAAASAATTANTAASTASTNAAAVATDAARLIHPFVVMGV
jgi:hypothetical protein